MKWLLAIVMFSFSATANAQADSNFVMPAKDSVLLVKFWTTLKEGINTKDKAKLASICHFPFSCSSCLDDSSLMRFCSGDNAYIIVTKKLFDTTSANKLFYEKHFVEFVNEQQSYFPFGPTYNQKGRVMGYEFSYLVNRIPGKQIFVYLNKYKDGYKIIATESIP